MDNLRDLVANAEFLGKPNMVSGLDSRPTSKESNDGQTGSDIGWRWCPLFVGEWGEAQEYLDIHHAMSRAHHNHYASSSLLGRTCPSKPEVLIDLSDSAYPLYAYTALHYRPLHGLSQATTMTSSWCSPHTTNVECTLPISTRRTTRHITAVNELNGRTTDVRDSTSASVFSRPKSEGTAVDTPLPRHRPQTVTGTTANLIQPLILKALQPFAVADASAGTLLTSSTSDAADVGIARNPAPSRAKPCSAGTVQVRPCEPPARWLALSRPK
ncbi:unnamed protein product [Spirodela intermedia]|uniref:Uncharacterized protein n=1 Tax=Spirodela intermedia TaxID=51605 RepID=A0ABN7EA11_SPIIN|nr:unnamed protein product [Spirodela intermedia]